MTTCWMRFQDQAKETSLYHSNQGCTDRKTKMTSVIFYFLMTSISFTFSKFSKISNILSENLIVQFESCSIKFLISWRFKIIFWEHEHSWNWIFMRIGFEFTLSVKLFTVNCAKVHRNLANFKFGSTEIDIENIKSAGFGGMFVPI